MDDRTGIQWTSATWNPVSGCSKVSQGCKHCYAERVFPRAYSRDRVDMPHADGAESWPVRARRFTDVVMHHDRLDQPLRWRKPRRIFVNSMSDLFHEDVPDEFIDRVFAIMSACDRHTFQVLTKRPERMRQWFASRTPDFVFGTPLAAGDPVGADPEEVSHWKVEGLAGEKRDNCGLDWPLRNVWLGVSCEDQETADERIPLLLRTPAAVRFVSAEPLLGPIDLRAHFAGHCSEHDFAGGLCLDRHHPGVTHINWVIAGGESGPKARACDVRWIRTILNDCQRRRIPVFVKQLGARPEWSDPTPDDSEPPHWMRFKFIDRAGGEPTEWPEDLRVREFP